MEWIHTCINLLLVNYRFNSIQNWELSAALSSSSFANNEMCGEKKMLAPLLGLAKSIYYIDLAKPKSGASIFFSPHISTPCPGQDYNPGGPIRSPVH